MARAARCHRSWYSTSDTATLNFFSRSLTRRRTIRFSFSDRAPGTCSSTVNSPTTINSRRDCDSFHREDFDHVADLDVVEPLEPDAAFEAGLDFAHIVLEPPERSDLPFIHDDVVANEPRLCLARSRDPPFGHH